MEIRRRAAQKPGAQVRTVVPEREPELAWDDASGRLILRVERNPAWREDGTYYDYEVFLTPADIDRVRRAVAGSEQPA